MFDAIPIRIIFCCCIVAAIIEICSIRLRKRPDAAFFDPSLAEIAILIIAIIFAVDVPLTGVEWIFIIGITVASDAGGLAFGKIIGWKKVEFLAKISPNKSYAGYLGEFICSWVAGIAIVLVFDIELSIANSIFLVSAWIFAACGDLIGSACKRFLGVKDSGEILKKVAFVGLIEVFVRSRKGYLDCFDSISMNLICFVALQFIMRSLT
jgi:CDP-diglyceride synthetase